MSDPESMFRSGFDALVETAPDPPLFDDIAVLTLGTDRSPRSRVWLMSVAALATVVLIGGVNLFTRPDTDSVLSRPSETSVPSPSTSSPAKVADPLFGEELPWTLVFDDGLSGVVAVDLNDPVERRGNLEGQRPGGQPYRMHQLSQYLITGWGEIFAHDLNDLTSTSLGDATIFVPAAETDRVWLVKYPSGRIGQGDPLVWQVFPNGAMASEPVNVEYDGLPTIGIPGGIALETDHGVALWNVNTQTVTGVLGSGTGFVSDSSSDGNLAWCEDTCEVLHVTNVLTGDDMTIVRPDPAAPEAPPFDARSARFANDHRFLASLAGNDVLVTDLKTGSTEVRVTGDKPYGFLGWSPFGPDLFASTYAYGATEVEIAHLHATGGEAQTATLPYGGTLGFVVVDTVQARWLLPDGTFLGCPVTLPEGDSFVPPSPFPSEPSEGRFWYGSEGLWTLLPVDGDYGERKSVWWSANFPGGGQEQDPDIRVEWRHHGLDAPLRTTQGLGTNAYTVADGWFMIADGFDPRTPGCWEVTAAYKGTTLSYVYFVPNPS